MGASVSQAQAAEAGEEPWAGGAAARRSSPPCFSLCLSRGPVRGAAHATKPSPSHLARHNKTAPSNLVISQQDGAGAVGAPPHTTQAATALPTTLSPSQVLQLALDVCGKHFPEPLADSALAPQGVLCVHAMAPSDEHYWDAGPIAAHRHAATSPQLDDDTAACVEAGQRLSFGGQYPTQQAWGRVEGPQAVDPVAVAALLLIHSQGVAPAAAPGTALPLHLSSHGVGWCQLPGFVVAWLAGEQGYDAYGAPPPASRMRTDPAASAYFCAAFCEAVCRHVEVAGLLPASPVSDSAAIHAEALTSILQAASAAAPTPRGRMLLDWRAAREISGHSCRPSTLLPQGSGWRASEGPTAPSLIRLKAIVYAYHTATTLAPAGSSSWRSSPTRTSSPAGSPPSPPLRPRHDAWCQFECSLAAMRRLHSALDSARGLGGGGGGPVMYMVGAGDSLGSIARAVGVSEQEVVDANPGLGADTTLRAHDCLALPVPTIMPRVCCLQAGDTLHGVAGRFGVPLHRLLSANMGLVQLDPRAPHPGWVLEVPGLYGQT